MPDDVRDSLFLGWRTPTSVLVQATPPDEAWTTRRSALASSLAELEQQVPLADKILRENTEQGRTFGNRTLNGLRTLITDQEALLAKA